MKRWCTIGFEVKENGEPGEYAGIFDPKRYSDFLKTEVGSERGDDVPNIFYSDGKKNHFITGDVFGRGDIDPFNKQGLHCLGHGDSRSCTGCKYLIVKIYKPSKGFLSSIPVERS